MSDIEPCEKCGAEVGSEDIHGGWAGDTFLCVPCMTTRIEELEAELAALRKAVRKKLRADGKPFFYPNGEPTCE